MSNINSSYSPDSIAKGHKLLTQLLHIATSSDSSDVHLKADAKVYLRVKGKLLPCTKEDISAGTIHSIVLASMEPEQREFMKTNNEIDYAYNPKDGTGFRYRVNAYTAQGNLEAVFRVIKNEVMPTGMLNLPEVVDSLAVAKQGLILVAGATGQGKSTTLGAMIDKINRTSSKRIITIENPVEMVHRDQQSVISQREVGEDTESFAVALRSVLRQDPDVILVGEIRDMETAEIALQAAQTGHLVLSTIHAGSAEETIKRFAGLYPAEERANVKRTLATTLVGIVAQRLVVDVENSKFPVMEIMVNNHRVTQCLLADAEDTPVENLTRVIADSEQAGMHTLDQYLIKMYLSGRITVETAFKEANEPLVMRQELQKKGYQIR